MVLTFSFLGRNILGDKMSVFDFFSGTKESSSDDPLSKPLADEQSDLSLHVELCARRYKSLFDKIADTTKRIKTVERLLWVVVVLLLLNKVIDLQQLGAITKIF